MKHGHSISTFFDNLWVIFIFTFLGIVLQKIEKHETIIYLIFITDEL